MWTYPCVGMQRQHEAARVEAEVVGPPGRASASLNAQAVRPPLLGSHPAKSTVAVLI